MLEEVLERIAVALEAQVSRQTEMLEAYKAVSDRWLNHLTTSAPAVEEPKKRRSKAVETPAPVAEVPAPVVEVPAPVVEAPAPVVETPAPAPAPDPDPVVETPAPVEFTLEQVRKELVACCDRIGKAETVKVLTSVGRAATAATVDPKLYPLLVEALRTATVPGAV